MVALDGMLPAAETGNWKIEIGNWKLENRNWKMEIGKWRLGLRIKGFARTIPLSF
jgi:hypothetical protein